MSCNRDWCSLCRIEREGCQCRASDIGCWFCAPDKLQRPECLEVYDYPPLPTPIGYSWIDLDDRGWHVAMLDIFRPSTAICTTPILRGDIPRRTLRLMSGMNPISLGRNHSVCGYCSNNAMLFQPLEIPQYVSAIEIDYDAAHRLEQQAKNADGLAAMLESKGDEEGATSQRKRSEKLRRQRKSILEPK